MTSHFLVAGMLFVAAGATTAPQTPQQQALDLYNAAIRESNPTRQIELLRQSIAAFETFDGSVALGDALVRNGGDPLEARELCSRAFSTVADPETPQGKKKQATALVCLARTYRATNEPAMAASILKRSIGIERLPAAEDELRAVLKPEFKSADEIAAELDRPSTRSLGASLPRGVVPVATSADIYVNFDFDRATLTADGVRQVAELARAITIIGSKRPAARFKLIGHTDTRGADEYNLDLSRRRAKTVADLLISRYGVAGAAIQTEGRGKREPLLTGDSEDVHARNRRVVVQFVQ